jgi:hypothetical protein
MFGRIVIPARYDASTLALGLTELSLGRPTSRSKTAVRRWSEISFASGGTFSVSRRSSLIRQGVALGRREHFPEWKKSVTMLYSAPFPQYSPDADVGGGETLEHPSRHI